MRANVEIWQAAKEETNVKDLKWFIEAGERTLEQ